MVMVGGIRAGLGVLSSGAFTAFQGLEIDKMLRLGPCRVMLPHLHVELLQVYGVLLGIEQRAAYALLPDPSTNHLQAGMRKEMIICCAQYIPAQISVKVTDTHYSMSVPSLTATSS